MSRSIKRGFAILMVCGALVLPGCRQFNYNESQDDKWLIEQIENGTLTTEEVQAIKAQQKAKD